MTCSERCSDLPSRKWSLMMSWLFPKATQPDNSSCSIGTFSKAAALAMSSMWKRLSFRHLALDTTTSQSSRFLGSSWHRQITAFVHLYMAGDGFIV